MGMGSLRHALFHLVHLVHLVAVARPMRPHGSKSRTTAAKLDPRPRSRRQRGATPAAIAHRPQRRFRTHSRSPAYHTHLGPGRPPLTPFPLSQHTPPWSEAWRGTTNGNEQPCPAMRVRTHHGPILWYGVTGPLHFADSLTHSGWVISGSTTSQCRLAS